MTLGNCWPLMGLGAPDAALTTPPPPATRVASQGSATYTSTGQIAGYGAAALGVVAVIGVGSALFFGRKRT